MPVRGPLPGEGRGTRGEQGSRGQGPSLSWPVYPQHLTHTWHVVGVCILLEDRVVNEGPRALLPEWRLPVSVAQGVSSLGPMQACGWPCPHLPARGCSSWGAAFSVWPPGKGFPSNEVLFTFLTRNLQQILTIHT